MYSFIQLFIAVALQQSILQLACVLNLILQKLFFPPPGQIAQRDRRPAVVQEIDPSILLREPLILKVKESDGRNQKASFQG